ncbi:MAG: DUF2254 domain-containing protein [Chloroflexi bacterium]|nr:DUF2254 domain-containing protein [Chloroflexota bacterium]
MTLSRLFINLKSSLWFVPVVCVVAGAVLSFGTILLDRHFDYQAIPTDLVGGPDAATAILSTVAASMVSLTALVLTITMVVVQLAMGQFSPRIVQRILQDKPSQLAIGLFVATLHAILAVREVTNEGDGNGQVPGIAVVTAFVLVLISIAVLVIYVHHIGQALRVSALIELVGKDTRQLLDRLYPDKGQPLEPESPPVVRARESGVITVVSYQALVEEARRAGCVLELVPALGDFIPAGAPLFPGPRGASRLGGRPAAPGGDPEAGADTRRRRRLRRTAPGRHRRTLAFRLALPGPHHSGPGHRQAARHPEPACAAAFPGRPPPRRVGRGPARRAVDELGGLRPPRLRRDPHGRGRFTASHSAAESRREDRWGLGVAAGRDGR